jgi:membrane protein DedA with SNARE-associated domain
MDPLGNLLPWIAACGILGILGVTLLERLVPILPSTALLISLGAAVAEGHVSLAAAFWSSTVGSLIGSLSFYGLGLALGEVRSFIALKRCASFFGLSEAQLGRLIVSFRRHERIMTFSSQLIPSLRLLAPGVAGLLRANLGSFLIATTLGVALWNLLFVGLGYAAALNDNAASASGLATKVVLLLLVFDVIAMGVWRVIVMWRRPVPAAERLKPQLATWLRNGTARLRPLRNRLGLDFRVYLLRGMDTLETAEEDGARLERTTKRRSRRD